MIALYCSAIILAIVCFGLIFINHKVDKMYEFVSDSIKYISEENLNTSKSILHVCNILTKSMEDDRYEIYKHFNKECELLHEKINILKAQMEDDHR